tara:strand:+ start:35274 stop:35603 length:330 start_codon:yes stop_codon:yes gene_type:complete
MSLRDDYRPTIMVLIGKLMSKAIEITAVEQIDVSVGYAGYVDCVRITVCRNYSDAGLKQLNQKLLNEHCYLEPLDPDNPVRARADWEHTIATLNRWHDYLTELQQQLAA